ncbi:MAG: hypothetical protein ACRCX8_18850 [Sarcina sp.]
MLKKNNGTLHETKYVIDEATGEVEYLTKDEVSWLENNRTSASVINDKGCIPTSGLFQMFIKEECGEYYHNYYENTLENKYLFRFIYLCTYMNYKNYLEYGEARGEKRLVVKKDLKEILGLKDQQHYDTINNLFKYGLILFDEKGYVRVNEEFCKKGKLKKKTRKVIRMFNNSIQDIYKCSSTREHERLGLLLRLIPYVHYKYNIICKNPEEEEVSLIEPLKQKEILEILNVDRTPIRNLLKLTIMDKKEYAFIKFSNGSFKNIFVINPRIMYKGNNLEEIEMCMGWFKLGIK